MKQLLVAIDPGFDSLKVVANGQVFKIPFNITETDERKMTDYALRDDFILYKDKDGATWRVGQYAREYVFENKDNSSLDESMKDFYSDQRFMSPSFIVGIRTAIALAIDANSLNDTPLDIYVMVALPHGCRTKYASTITGKLVGSHTFTVRHGSEEERLYDFSIEEDHIMTVSQTIAAIIGETSDVDGNIDPTKFRYLTNGPTLAIDGGYFTVGLVEVSKGGSVDDDKTESDTHHAMKNINMLIAEEIKNYRPDIKHYVIEYMLSQNDGKIKYMQDGHVQIVDLNTIKKEKTEIVCESFIEYLNKKYNNLLDFNYVLVTGGTGYRFYKQMKKFYTGAGIFDDDHFLLTSSDLMGTKYSIEYAIAIGAYKGLRGKVIS